MSAEIPERHGVTRLSFFKASAGAAAAAPPGGVTAGGVMAPESPRRAPPVGVPAAVILAEESPGVATAATSAPQADTVMAYVRDAVRGEVTIVAGQSELTYRDPALVKRLMAAAPKSRLGTV